MKKHLNVKSINILELLIDRNKMLNTRVLLYVFCLREQKYNKSGICLIYFCNLSNSMHVIYLLYFRITSVSVLLKYKYYFFKY